MRLLFKPYKFDLPKIVSNFAATNCENISQKSEGKFNESFLAQTKYIETQAGAPVGMASACSRNAGAQINK
jgi:hypothetical protein